MKFVNAIISVREVCIMIWVFCIGVPVAVFICLWIISKCRVLIIKQGDPAHMQEYLDAKSLIIKAFIPKEVKKK